MFVIDPTRFQNPILENIRKLTDSARMNIVETVDFAKNYVFFFIFSMRSGPFLMELNEKRNSLICVMW
jgi:hypothetical protein